MNQPTKSPKPKREPLEFSGLLHALPKVEIHCHMLGASRPETWADIALKNKVALPGDPALIFSRIDSGRPHVDFSHAVIPMPIDGEDPPEAISLFTMFDWISGSLRAREDFRRLAFECAEDAFRKSNVRYQEVFFGFARLLGHHGHSYPEIIDGLIEGFAEAERQYGIRSRIICGISRHYPPSAGMEIVEEMILHRRDEVIGIGLDGYELAGAPGLFADVFARARAAGFKCTAHSSEHAPVAENTTVCLDVLKCDRIDHGYFILQDPEVVKRCCDQEVHFTCACTTSHRAIRPWRRKSIARMVELGLNVSLCADDPSMFPTTLSREYAVAHEEIGLPREKMLQLWLNPIEASWLDESGKRDLRASFLSAAAKIPGLDASPA